MLRITAFFFAFAIFLSACGDDGGDQLFSKLSKSRTGVNFRNILRESEDMNVLLYQYFYNGAGVAVGDLNNDGLQDIFFSGNMAKNRLFLNEGNFNFQDITETSGVAGMQGWCTGATMVDINADGWLDIYVCRSADVQPSMRRNLLFINNGPPPLEGNSASTPLEGGRGVTFTESAAAYGLADPGYSTHAAFFDYDKDGDLDAFIINHSLNEYAGEKSAKPGMRDMQNPDFQSKLYRNDTPLEGGRAVFKDVSEEAGITGNVLSFGLGLGVADVNGDSWPDIYVCNDFNEQDYFFVNNQDGTFSESLAQYFDHTSHFSMGCDIADFNNDGLPDLATVDMLADDPALLKMHAGPDNWKKFDQLFSQGFYYQSMRNMLQLNNGPTPREESSAPPPLENSIPREVSSASTPLEGGRGVTFSEIAQLAGTSNTDWSWGILMADFDNDGWKDLVMTNGYVKDYTDMDFLNFATGKAVAAKNQGEKITTTALIQEMKGSNISKFAFKNQGDLTFQNTTQDWGLDEPAFSNGIAYADLDNDGDLDLVVNNINDYASIYRNNADKLLKNNWLKLKLEGEGNNPQGIGAKVWVYAGGSMQYFEQQPSRGYESSVDHRLHVGLGEKTVVDSLRIDWPNGESELVKNIPANQLLTLSQVNASQTLTNHQLLITSHQSPLPFIHKENNFVDFNTQFLLPHFLSRRGPCVVSGDVNGDDLEDLYFGGAQGQAGALLLQKADGSFYPQITPAFAADAGCEDTGSAFFDADGDGDLDLYVVSGGYEKPAGDVAYQDRLYLNNGQGRFEKITGALPTETLPGSCAVPGDFDGDGDLDLFVGGHCVPGNYPSPAESMILLNDGKGHFTNETEKIAPALRKPGLVTDAVWLPKERQLIVAGEWMSISAFDFTKIPISGSQSPIPNSNGWWNRLTAADLDGDGDLDLIAGNLGQNSQVKVSAAEPAELYAADFDGNGSVDPIFTHYRHGKSYPAASRDDLGGQMPSIKKKFTDYQSYATATINDIATPEQLALAMVLKADNLSTVWLENTGNGFEMRSLPVEAQFAPVYAIAAADFNGDGHADLFLAGNNRWSRIYFGRYDANHGQVFLGDGKGGFHCLPPSQTGISIRADVRDATLVKGKNGSRVVVGVNDGQGLVLDLIFLKK